MAACPTLTAVTITKRIPRAVIPAANVAAAIAAWKKGEIIRVQKMRRGRRPNGLAKRLPLHNGGT
jgi:hypothetical protein